MDKSITQATQNDKQISKSIKRFFYTNFEVRIRTAPNESIPTMLYYLADYWVMRRL